MKLYFLTLFPEIYSPILETSILGRAHSQNHFDYELVNIRDFASDKHKTVDDRPYGGGPGMVMKADILETALLHAFHKEGISTKEYSREDYSVIVTAAAGDEFTQAAARSFIHRKALFFVAGHYEGIDQRFVDYYADYIYRIGQYVLTGGELPTLVMADAILRLIPGVLGSDESSSEESFSFSDEKGLLLEYPHYTRPAEFQGIKVPDVLISGNHKAIAEWRLERSREVSSALRKDLPEA